MRGKKTYLFSSEAGRGGVGRWGWGGGGGANGG